MLLIGLELINGASKARTILMCVPMCVDNKTSAVAHDVLGALISAIDQKIEITGRYPEWYRNCGGLFGSVARGWRFCKAGNRCR